MFNMTTAEAVFNEMKQIIEAPNFNLLTHFKDDFYKYDRKMLESWWHPNAKALWIVRGNGTHLNFIGYHQKSVDMVEASLHAAESNSFIAHVSAKGIEKVNKEKALRLANELVFETRNGTLLHRGKPVGSICCEMRRDLANLYATVKVYAKDLHFNSKFEEKMALTTVAGHEAVLQSQSLFIGIDDVIFNDMSLVTPEVAL